MGWLSKKVLRIVHLFLPYDANGCSCFLLIIFVHSEKQSINIEDIYRVIYVQNSNITTALRVAELEIPISDEKEVVLEFIRNSTKGIMRGLS